MMETKDYLAYISKVIHTTIVATVDDERLPVTTAIDMMDSDNNSLYFLTAKGKDFYDRKLFERIEDLVVGDAAIGGNVFHRRGSTCVNRGHGGL